MRCSATLLCVLTLLVALPQRLAAQTGEEAAASAAAAVSVRYHLPPPLMLRASYYLYLDAAADVEAASAQAGPNAEQPRSAQADGGVGTSESNPDEPVSSPSLGTEVPDIDTLGQRSIENYEIQSAQSYAQRGRQGGRREGISKGGKIAIGVIVPLTVVSVALTGWAVASLNNWDWE